MSQKLPLVCAFGVLVIALTHEQPNTTPNTDFTEAAATKAATFSTGDATMLNIHHNETKIIYENASNFLANERTYLAWIRTVETRAAAVTHLCQTHRIHGTHPSQALAMMSIGFGAAKLSVSLH